MMSYAHVERDLNMNEHLSNSNGIRTYSHLLRKRTLSHLAKPTEWLSWVVSTYLYRAFDCISLSCHVSVSEWIYTPNLPECQGTPCLIQRNIWRLSDSNGIRTHSHLVRKSILNHLSKPVKWLSCVLSTYLYVAFDCMLFSCYVRVSEWIYTL